MTQPYLDNVTFAETLQRIWKETNFSLSIRSKFVVF